MKGMTDVKKTTLFFIAALILCFSGCISDKKAVNNDAETNISVPENENANTDKAMGRNTHHSRKIHHITFNS